jgi:cytochrome c oxidase assembly protein subunit 15
MNKPLKIFLRTLIIMTFILISLGGAVRAMNAGLSCPDWPLCFGQFVPDFHVQVYYEFIHRVLAGCVAMFTFALAIYFYRRNFPKNVKRTVLFGIGILITQIVFGGLTVLKLLKFSVVTAHLAFGMTFLCSLLWLYFQLFDESNQLNEKTPKSFHSVLFVVLVMLAIQILLGGLVSTNYAGLTCEGFPLCNGELAPTFHGLVGLQVKHRLWGYLTALAIFSFSNLIWRNRKQKWMNPQIVKYGLWLSVLIVLQIIVGASNVIFQIPPIITVIHLAMAATLLGLMLRIFYKGIKN